MEVFSLLILLVILVVLISFKGDVKMQMGDLEKQIMQLRQQVAESLKERPPTNIPAPEKVQKPIIEKPVIEEPYWKSNFKVAEAEEAKPQPIQETPKEESRPTEKIPVAAITEIPREKIYHQPPPPQPKPSFFERNPDLEKFIGENLISKIGIGILVLAIAYFVKFAIDNNWIGEIGRVAVGLVCGGILVGLAHWLRNSYKAFSSVLIGGGIAVFYFTIALAYHQFHLFGQTTAFIIMLAITMFTVAIALLYDRQEVAIIALVGGFASPFMASDGSGNYKTLFIYLIVLNAGLLVIAYNKTWRLLNLLAFIFTVILVGGWLFALSQNENPSVYQNGFIFCTIFYLLFFAINLAHNIRENKKFIASDFGILLANTSLYFGAGLFCLYCMKATEYKGLLSASLAVFNLAASYVFFKNKKVDTNILYLLIGITLTFVSLTAPLQMEGNYITLFWASEAVLLYWLYGKSDIEIIGITSSIVWVCMLMSLAMDWSNVYSDVSKALPVIINKGFITTIYAAIACYVLYLFKQRNAATNSDGKLTVSFKSVVFYAASIILLFLAGAFEINHQFLYHYPGTSLNALYLELYSLAFILLFLIISSAINTSGISVRVEKVLLSAAILIYLGMISNTFSIQTDLLERRLGAFHFNFSHWLSAICLAAIIYRLINIYRKDETKEDLTRVTWIICIVIIIFLSVEMNLLIRSLFYSNSNTLTEVQRVYIKTVLPILWGLSSFVFMWLGMQYKFRPLRIISLSLFSLTLAKLFLFDIQNIPIAGKIAAFFCLGVLLLVVSFMYQRLKKIIIEDEQKPVV